MENNVAISHEVGVHIPYDLAILLVGVYIHIYTLRGHELECLL